MMKPLPESYRLIFLYLTICICCERSADRFGPVSFTIRGVLSNVALERIYLSRFIDGQFMITDTASVAEGGHFQFNGEVPSPDIVRISLSPENGFELVIDAAAIEVRADAEDLRHSVEVKGSGESLLLQELMEVTLRYQRDASDIERGFRAAQSEGRADSVIYYQEKYLAVVTEMAASKKDFVRRHSDSFAAAFAAYALIDEGEDEFLDSMLIAFNETIPRYKYVQLLNERRRGGNPIAVGNMAPDIVLPQPDGTPFRASSLRGSYVLIDFWASWCRPCREENPRVVKLYSQYHDKGFEILGVSLDESKEQWMRAIETDKLPWHHVSDLKGLGSVAIQLYDVQAIPMTVLLDREGRVLELHLRGDALADRLAELFPE